MRKVTYSLSPSLDGYIVGPDGSFGWSEPDDELFRFATDEVEALGVHLLGRRLYESMLYWEPSEPDPAVDGPTRRFASLWRSLPKVVFSSTLSTVEGNARLATGSVAEEIERLRDEPGEGNIGIGGAALAAAAAEAGLIDEYRLRIYPVLVGGGTSYFPHTQRQDDLELLDTRTFSNGVVHLRYGVRR